MVMAASLSGFVNCYGEPVVISKPRPGTPAGYAAPPGSGPEGETCGTCNHLYRRKMAKTYLKCELMQARWTGGKGTDVRSRSPACLRWEGKP